MSNLDQPNGKVGSRTLLLSPPGLSSHPEALNDIVAAHDRNATDIQMLDRLSVGLVKLPESTYDNIMLLTDADGTRNESSQLLGRDTLQKVVQSLKAGGRLRSQDQTFGKASDGEERREAILAGLVWEETGELVKPDSSAIASVPLRLGKKTAAASHPSTASTASQSSLPQEQLATGKGNVTKEPTRPAGVGFVDFSDDLDMEMEEDDDELIDEDTLLDEADLARPIIQPAECRPKAGKRRRACKDCTCGLKEKIEAEDSTKRANADKALSTIKIGADDLAEVDFTVQGKVGSCGNCSLGDAFRCDGCPYIGLPAFKPGEEVRLLNDEAQL